MADNATADSTDASTPAEPGPDATQLAYLRRRAVAVIAAGIGIVGMVAVWLPALTAGDIDGPLATSEPDQTTSEDTLEAAGNVRDASARHPLDLIVADAAAHYERTGQFGPSLDGVDHVAVADTVVVVARFEGACWMAGYIDGVTVAADIDPTEQACTPDALDALRAELSEAEAYDRDVTDDTLTRAADGLSSWAAASGGDLHGAGRPGVDVEVTGDGQTATLTIDTSTRCRTLTVHSDGQRTEPSDC